MEKKNTKKITIKKNVVSVAPVSLKPEGSLAIKEEMLIPMVKNTETEVNNIEDIGEGVSKVSVISADKPTSKISISKKSTNTNQKSYATNSLTLNNSVLSNNGKKQNNFEKDKIAKAMTLRELDEKSILDLRKIAETLDVKDSPNYSKNDLIIKILEEQTKRGGNIFAEGVLEIINDGSHGVLRSLKMLPGTNDVYVSGSQIKRFNL